MSSTKLKKELKKDKLNSTVHLLNKAESLGIKYELIHKEEKEYYIKLFYKNKFIYIFNSQIYRNLDKISILQVSNKNLVKQVLAEKNIKVPTGFIIHKFSEIKPLLKKHKLDFPLVLKPGFAACGKGVAPNLKNYTDLKTAFSEARKIEHKFKDRPIIIEEYFPARDFRVLVFQGKTIACCERTRPQVKGDGQSSIRQLIKKHKKSRKINIDWELKRNLKEQRVSLSSVPQKNELIYLRKNTNIDQGGLSINRSSEICSKFKKIAIQAAKEFNAQLVGVDFLVNDISDPKADYRVIELNDNPGLHYLHDKPDIGKSEEVFTKILKAIFKIK